MPCSFLARQYIDLYTKKKKNTDNDMLLELKHTDADTVKKIHLHKQQQFSKQIDVFATQYMRNK